MSTPGPVSEIYDDSRADEDTAKIVVDDVAAMLHKCPRFRILIVGKTGVGKSTIASRVFGIPYDDIQTEIGSIWTPIPTDVNDNIIIHDSGGFEAGDNNDSIAEVEKFILERRSKPQLQDQIHCIW
jgi:predicted GTPase